MSEDTYFKPRKVTDLNDRLDEDANLCIRNLFRRTQAVAHNIKCHDKEANTDGCIILVDEEERPVGELTVQAKTYKTVYKGKNKALIPTYFVSYAKRIRNKVYLFFSVESDANRIYWKYISDDYIREFESKGDNEGHVYQFATNEIVTSDNVAATIERWKQIFNEKVALLAKEKKSAEEIMTESRSAFCRINTDFHDLKNSFIERKEIGILYQWVKDELPQEESFVKLLVGNAGMGKSVVIKQVIQRLEADGISSFSIKADKLQTPIGYTSNEHLKLLINTFASLIQEKRAVLIIDQIDALSQYIQSDRNKLENIITLVKLFSGDEKLRNVRIIISCRSFDLDFDPKLSIFKRESQIKLGFLDKEDVEKVLDRLKKGLYKELDDKTKSVLQTPQHLNLFCRVYAKNKRKEYYSITDLYDELWLQTIGLTDNRINKEVAERILFNLALKIYDDETLTPQWDYDTSELKEANYLISEGIIEQINDRASFFHQSMYDYVFARYYTKEKRSFIHDLMAEKKHQGLFVRSTINLVLDYERTKNVKQYKEDVKAILFSGEIRPHIQLMLLWAMANRINILPFEKKCIKDLYSQNKLLFYSFIRRTYNKEWYKVITPIIAKDIIVMKIGDGVYDNVYGYFWNHVQMSTEDVFILIDCIKDEITRNKVAQNVLRATPYYSLEIITKWYKIICDEVFSKAIFLERALPSNPQFVIGNISELISYLIKNEKGSGAAERTIEEICNTLVKNYPNDFYPILRDIILDTINSCRVTVWRGIIEYNKAFPLLNHDYSESIHAWFIGLLKNKIKTDSSTSISDIKLLLAQKETCCYEYAFEVMIENPILFSDDIITILKSNELLDEILTYGNMSYYFLELLKKWFTQVTKRTLEESQELIYNFKSQSGSISKKDKSSVGSHLPYLGYNQRKLIWAIPENLRNSQIKRLKLELDRKFGKEWINEKPDHDITAASICGGLMSAEQYKTVSFETWKKSFYGVKNYANGKQRFFDENVHADSFKQCVSERPDYFSNFVFSLFDDKRIPERYKLAGLEGLAFADYPTKQIIPSLWRLIDSFDKLSNEGRGYRLFELINYLTSKEGEHIEKIIEFLKRVILSEYESKYNPVIENQFDNSVINESLHYGINSIQGQAIESLSLIGKHEQRKEMIYDFFMDSNDKLSIEHQLAVMLHLQRECYDNNLYNKIMFTFANRPIADYLFLNSNRMHWFWCNDPEKILPYFKMILPQKRGRLTLVQILFFGMQYDKSKDISKEMFELIISQNESEVIKTIIPLAYKHLSDDTYGLQSEILLRRFANDNRDEIRQTNFIYCSRMPNTQIYLFKDLLESWISLPLDNGFHDIIRYIKKCCNDYPDECYQCAKLLWDNKNNITYYDEEELIKILFSCYRSYLDYDESEKADEVMDLFDSMMLSSYSNKVDKILKKIEENS